MTIISFASEASFCVYQIWQVARLTYDASARQHLLPAIFLDVVCSCYYTLHMESFGTYVRTRREVLHAEDKSMSLRQVALRIGVEPAFLSKIERDVAPPPSEAKIVALAQALSEDPDLLLAMAGKVSSDLQAIIRRRPQLIGELLRQLKAQPDHAILSIVRQVTDGDW